MVRTIFFQAISALRDLNRSISAPRRQHLSSFRPPHDPLAPFPGRQVKGKLAKSSPFAVSCTQYLGCLVLTATYCFWFVTLRVGCYFSFCLLSLAMFQYDATSRHAKPLRHSTPPPPPFQV
ncbi:hypothetical protein E2C01_006705 [Portunus trituberculatus]|uniref:Uncharacterized protein n=1 Tax=Portunus trituberculatus TaxID=210409 RepID=A0A5B7D2I9_PORTR|nr:hypothetical protein [Portunus trituberculatus]